MPTLSHSTALRRALAAIDAKAEQLGPEVAKAMAALLRPCAGDLEGTQTLDALTAVFEDHDAVIDAELAQAFANLTNATHAMQHQH